MEQDALVNIGWHKASLGDCAVPGGHLHSAIVPPLPAAGPSSIVSGHGAPICHKCEFSEMNDSFK